MDEKTVRKEMKKELEDVLKKKKEEDSKKHTVFMKSRHGNRHGTIQTRRRR